MTDLNIDVILKVLFIAILLISSGTFYCNNSQDEAGEGFKILNFIGSVTIKTDGKNETPIIGDILDEGDTIATADGAFCEIMYTDSYLIRINQKSSVIIKSILSTAKNSTEMELEEGQIYATISKLRKGDEFRVRTMTQTASVRGTTFGISADEDSTKTEVIQGKVLINPVVEGNIVADVEEVVEENDELVLDKKKVREAVKKRRLKKSRMRARAIKSIRADMAKINPEVVDMLNKDMRKEIRIGIMKMRKADFEASENKRKTRVKVFKKRLKAKHAEALKRRTERRKLRKEKRKILRNRTKKIRSQKTSERRKRLSGKTGVNKIRERRKERRKNLKAKANSRIKNRKKIKRKRER